MIEGVLLVSAVGLICRDFWAGGPKLKPDGRLIVTVMDFGRGFPLDPLPQRRHRKFWMRLPTFTVKDGVPSMWFETHDSASMLFRHVDIDLAAYQMLPYCWYIEVPIRSLLDERTAKETINRRLFLRFVTDRGEKRAMQVIWSNRPKREGYKYIGSFPDFVPMPAMNASAIGSTRGSISPGSTPRYERLRRRRLCSATETTRTPPASAILPICGVSGAKARWPAERLNKATTRTLCR